MIQPNFNPQAPLTNGDYGGVSVMFITVTNNDGRQTSLQLPLGEAGSMNDPVLFNGMNTLGESTTWPANTPITMMVSRIKLDSSDPFTASLFGFCLETDHVPNIQRQVYLQFYFADPCGLSSSEQLILTEILGAATSRGATTVTLKWLNVVALPITGT